MKSVKVGDLSLAVNDRGESRSARQPVLLLVHGFPLDHTMWESQLEFFSRYGRVVAADLRAFGGSANAARQSADAETLSIETYADDLAALLDWLGITGPIVFCGLSMGGYIGWQFCAKYAARCAALVACDTRSIADTPQAAAARAEMARRTLAEGNEYVATAMLPKLFASVTIASDAPCVAETRTVIHRASREGIAGALGAMASRPDMTEFLPSIRVPSQIVVGEQDAISNVEEMRGIAERIPGAEFAVIPAAGHMSPLENPAAFNSALQNFLKQHAGWTFD
jgi:pimeloyl-ACP methyl ester carboxylesterase